VLVYYAAREVREIFISHDDADLATTGTPC
jgi:hypothetical protein